ncbi:carboxymuconolactone decarboxylase family protein [Arenibacter amylolyticus]|uniref:carboxymuconolactone decarboxylase family protein n=1 Tax=Arenibacter amylolyticus TaxID=1406873 RepID=UPI000A37591F|nr:carboxymuconolactone decarboxylase family protein [Arenibacter amylolyticus]
MEINNRVIKKLKTLIFASLATFLLGFTASSKAQATGSTTKMLDNKQKSIIIISSLTAKGDMEKLETALVDGLDSGLTVNEIKEVMVHLYAYCGFPRSLRGMRTFIKVLEERKVNGIKDIIGKDASLIEDTIPKYDRGKVILEELVQNKLDGPPADYAQFAPIIEVFLKEHLFADIFERDILNYQQRELVTVSVLATIGGVEPMLSSHLNICLIQGITPEQLSELVDLLEKNVDRSKIVSAREVLSELLEPKK